MLVTVDGIEYAIVSDDNYHFMDPYWKAMYEAPSFLTTPSGPPIAIGGSATAKKVAVGGKLGIVKDPFGKQGTPQYLGATLPLDGYGIINLGVSEDGKVLIGQLKGGFSGNLALTGVGSSTAFPSQSHAWNVADLIHAAVAMPDKDRMSKHINVLAYPNIEQLVKNDVGLVAGTFFDAGPVDVSAAGNMGDIIEVDLKRLVAYKLLKLPAPDTLNAADKLLIKAREADINSIMAALDNFTFVAGEQQNVMSDTAQMQLLTKDKKVFNESSVVTSADQNFRNTGMMYFAPNITPDDLKTLRSGGTLSAGKKVSDIQLSYTLKKDVNGVTAGTSKITLKVSATDIPAGAVFFGDRPLDNPGYSKFTLKTPLVAGLSNDTIDVYRVEQRLKYLGYGSSAIQGSGEITVNGTLDNFEEADLNQFNQIVQGKTTYTAYSNFPVDANWLNAYNAPHWMQYNGNFFGQQAAGADPNAIKLNGWVDETKSDNATSTMGTSWVYDLMIAAQNAAAQQGRTAENQKLWFAGAGELGAQLNLGINTAYVSKANQEKVNGKDIVLGLVPNQSTATTPNAAAYDIKSWDYANAVGLSDLLLNPNRVNYTGETRTGANPENTPGGQNQQNQALLDFVAVYSATQNEPAYNTGSLEEQLGLIHSATTDAQKLIIQQALFGDGTKAGGLIDSSNLLLGGAATALGSQMTATTLGLLMGNVPGVSYVDWVVPLQQAMAEFNVNTPQRIAAFLAQVVNETTGLKTPVENPLRFTPSNLRNPGLFGDRFTGDSGHTDAAGNPLDWAAYLGSAANSTLLPEERARQIANRQYNGKIGNVNGTDDGWSFRGRGPLHLTGRVNYEGFASYFGVGSATYNQIMNNPEFMNTDFNMMARSAAWYWSRHVTNVDTVVELNPPAYSAVQNPITNGWIYDPFTTNVTTKIASDRSSYQDRHKSWQRNVDFAYGTNGKPSGNPYESMRDVLNRVGIKSTNSTGFESKFGITLHLQAPLEIGGGTHALMADMPQTGDVVPMDSVLNGTMQSLLTEAQNALGLNQGETTMLIADMPNAPLSMPAIVMMAQANTAQKTVKAREHILGICNVVNILGSGQAVLYPVSYANDYFKTSDETINWSTAKITVLQQPKHGLLEPISSNGDWSDPRYLPNDGYLGNDSFVFLVEENDYKVKLHYFIAVTDDFEVTTNPNPVCKGGQYHQWKISQNANGNSILTAVDTQLPNASVSPLDPATQQGNPALAALLANASLSFTGFADLAGGALGQTTGNTITLDTNAAGNNWYIDATPGDNAEYLPTSNPFLSLYALTQADGQAGLTGHIVNTTAANLFGGMITGVHIGGEGNSQNPYPSINAILGKLRISSSIEPVHQSHFHIYLKPPTPKQIGSARLLADAVAASQLDSTTPATLPSQAQGLLDYTLTLIEGEELMFIMDVPSIPAQQTPIVLAQAATPAASATPQPDFILKTCQETEHVTTAFSGVAPAGLLSNFMQNKYNRPVDFSAIKNITLLEAPKHGKINSDSVYIPEPNYIGNDRAVFLAEFEGKVYKIVINLVVSLQVNENPLTSDMTPVCPPPKLIKVNGKPVSGSIDYNLGNITVTFADLPAGALGQTTGSTITLDTNAAGNNWYIDATPGDNAEYLPTSNPNEWVAKAGSAAAGKMDMLSVLLHEYGHALGIDHSADGHDYMGTTLTAGVRRLPTADEMALMQHLIAQAKSGLAGSNTQDNVPNPFPTLPLGGMGIAFAGLLQRNRYGGLNAVLNNSTLTQYDVAANATLTNGNLSSANGWATQGSVNFTPASTSSGQASFATLSETSTTQTRLSQVFMVNANDRYLSFTLSGTALDNMNGAPDDAFEVALLNANTGLSLLGSNGLTHSDAFLNLQADGTENLLPWR